MQKLLKHGGNKLYVVKHIVYMCFCCFYYI